MSERIYVVSDGKTERLIEAPSAAVAIRFCTQHYKADLAGAKKVAELVKAGTDLESAYGDKTASP